MLRKVVVVEPHSPSKTCVSCQSALNSNLVCCHQCGTIQPFPPDGLSCFEVLSIFPRPQIDDVEVREKFYELSKITHPDKVVQLPEDQKRRALEWSAAINRAYRTLKDPLCRMEELLNHFKIPRKKGGGSSLELAEAYFDFQEKWLEGDRKTALQEFMTVFNQAEANWKTQWDDLIRAWSSPSEPSADNLALLENIYETRKYLDSLKRDLMKYQVPS